MAVENDLLAEVTASLPGCDPNGLTLTSEGGLASAFPVSELATVTMGAAALAASRLAGTAHASVDRRLASAWFDRSLYPEGWNLPSPWDAVAGDYRSRDGWIRLHTNAPSHRAAALSVLGVPDDREAVAKVAATWSGAELENAVVTAGGCAAVMHTSDSWATSAQGLAVGAEPLIAWTEGGAGRSGRRSQSSDRPLAGVRVLDLTRILAGPVATRVLAVLGAEVLRVDPPGWDETLIPEIALGKRTTRLDLRVKSDRDVFTTLLAEADVIVHGYRPGALDALGFGMEQRHLIRPGLVDVSVDAYGWSGPLATRRGFDSLVQMSAGIAEAGMASVRAARPVPLPVQALDHATGYLMVAAALTALARQRDTGEGSVARLSLARTAGLLLPRVDEGNHEPFAEVGEGDFDSRVELTSWGPARRLRYPFAVDGVRLAASPARALGLDRPVWT